MDGEKKKRKMDEEDEEEKIEKFFALVKSTREVRERLISAAAENKEAPAADKPQSPPPWNPTFVLEDFVEAPPRGVEQTAAAEAAGTSRAGEKQESGEKSGKKGLDLDLNLSL